MPVFGHQERGKNCFATDTSFLGMGKKVDVGPGSHHCRLWRALGAGGRPPALHGHTTAPTAPAAGVHRMTDHGESSLGDARRHRDYQELPGTLPEPPRHVGFPGSGVLAYLASSITRDSITWTFPICLHLY